MARPPFLSDEYLKIAAYRWWVVWGLTMGFAAIVGLFVWFIDFGCSGDFMDSGHDIGSATRLAHFCSNVLGEMPNANARGFGLTLVSVGPLALTGLLGGYGLIRRRSHWAKAAVAAGMASSLGVWGLMRYLGG